MDQTLINVINHIQEIKHGLYLKYKPELISGLPPIYESIVKSSVDKAPLALQRLKQQQSKLLYRNNPPEPKPIVTEEEQRQTDETIKQQLSSRINFRSAREECENATIDTLSQMQKSWHKLPNSLKIQAITKFIDNLAPQLTSDQINQLRYLLISSISNRILTKVSEIDYNSELGQINQIKRLVYDGKCFKLSESDAGNQAISIQSQLNNRVPPMAVSVSTQLPSVATQLPSVAIQIPPIQKIKINLTKIKQNQ